MKIKRLSMRALSYLLSILMLTGCLALPMSVSAATITVTVGVKEGCEDMGSFTINGVEGTSAEVNPGEEVTIEAVPAESSSALYKYALKQWDDGSTDSTITFTAQEGQTYNFTAEFAEKYRVKSFVTPSTISMGGKVSVTDDGLYAFAGDEVVVNVKDKLTITGHGVADFLFYQYTGGTRILEPGKDYEIEYIDGDKANANITIKNFSPATDGISLNSFYDVGGGTKQVSINPNNRISCYVDGTMVTDPSIMSATIDASTKTENSTLVITVTKKNEGYEWLPFQDGYTNNTSSFFRVRAKSNGLINLNKNKYDYHIEDVDANTRKITIMRGFNDDSSGPYYYEFGVKEKLYNLEITGYDENGNQMGSTKTIQYSFADGDRAVDISDFTKTQTSVFRDYALDYWNDDKNLTEYIVDTSSLNEGDTIQLKAHFRKAKVTVNVSSSNPDEGEAFIYVDRQKLNTIKVDSGTELNIYAKSLPDSLYAFTSWSDGKTSNPYVVTYHGEQTVNLVANFSGPKDIVVSSSNSGLGLVKINEGTAAESVSSSYKLGSSITIQAVPETGKATFVKWSDGVTTNPRTVTVTESGASEYVAEFKGKTYNAYMSISGSMDYKTFKVTNKADGSHTYRYLDTAVAEFEPGDTVEKWYWEDEVDENGDPVYHYPSEGKLTREYVVKGETPIKVVSIGIASDVTVRVAVNDDYEYQIEDPVYRAGETYKFYLKDRLKDYSEEYNPTGRPYKVKIGETVLPDIYRALNNSGYFEITPKVGNVWLTGDMELIPIWFVANESVKNFDGAFEPGENMFSYEGRDFWFETNVGFSFYINPDSSIASIYRNQLVPKKSFYLRYGTAGEKFDDWQRITYEEVEVDGVTKAKITVPGEYAKTGFTLFSNDDYTIKYADYLNGILKIKHEADSDYSDSIKVPLGKDINYDLIGIQHQYFSGNNKFLPQKIKLTTEDGTEIPEECYEYNQESGYVIIRSRFYDNIIIEADSKIYVHNDFIARNYEGYLVVNDEDTVPNDNKLDKLNYNQTFALWKNVGDQTNFSEYQCTEANSVEYGKPIKIKYDGTGRYVRDARVVLAVFGADTATLQDAYNGNSIYGYYQFVTSNEFYDHIMSWYDESDHTITIPAIFAAGVNINVSEATSGYSSRINGTPSGLVPFFEGASNFHIETTYTFAYLPEEEHMFIESTPGYVKGVDYTLTRSADGHAVDIHFNEPPTSGFTLVTDRTYSVYVYDFETDKLFKVEGLALAHNTCLDADSATVAMGYRPESVSVHRGIVENGKIVKYGGSISGYQEGVPESANFDVYEDGYKFNYNRGYDKFQLQNFAVYSDIIIIPGAGNGIEPGTSGGASGGYEIKVWGNAHNRDLKYFTKTYGDCVNGYKTLKYWYCEECNQYYSNEYGTKIINPDSYIYYPHELEHVDAHDGEDCQHNGILAHFECTKCHATFYDPDANQKMPNPGKHKYAPYWVWEKKGDTYEYDFTLENRCSLCGHIEETVKADDVTYDKDDQGNVTAHAKAVLFGKTYTLDHTYNVGLTFEVVNGTIVSGKKDSNYTASDRIKVKADAAPSGKVFEGWYEGDTKIASTEEFDYFIDHNAVITAKYTDSKPVIVNPVECSIINNGRKWYNKAAGTTSAKLTFRYNLTEYLNGKHYYIKEAGILRSYTVDEPSFDNYDNSTVVKKVACKNKFNFTFNYTLNMSASKKTSDVYMRGYIKYIDFNTGKEFIAYTDVTKFDAMS